jgi:hypothetical protein
VRALVIVVAALALAAPAAAGVNYDGAPTGFGVGRRDHLVSLVE